ncbi:hypothetical protein PT974_11692 [Cladobotryum mycophilum]|uniref:BAH domain-containing protein n=1 Tax=Cladobotryum mycophilum TaxID=491253 RepID=A0ABR0S6Y8_9HYPO
MTSKSKKRPLQSLSESPSQTSSQTSADTRAHCPYSATTIGDSIPDSSDTHASKKRKSNGPANSQRLPLQPSPFQPTGKFKSSEGLDSFYKVEPAESWHEMTRYNSFVLHGCKYFIDDFVYISNQATVAQQSKAVLPDDGSKKVNDYWVARILEVRAKDQYHVYARIYWMYWPEDLPTLTLGNKKVYARQPYHGQHELVASNHMDVINVVSVSTIAKVKHWIESNDDDVQDALYWRQAYDTRFHQLSAIDLVCRCSKPANPDSLLVGCTNAECEIWLHYDCLLHDVLIRVYDALGTDTPHKTEEKAVNGNGEDGTPVPNYGTAKSTTKTKSGVGGRRRGETIRGPV